MRKATREDVTDLANRIAALLWYETGRLPNHQAPAIYAIAVLALLYVNEQWALQSAETARERIKQGEERRGKKVTERRGLYIGLLRDSIESECKLPSLPKGKLGSWFASMTSRLEQKMKAWIPSGTSPATLAEPAIAAAGIDLRHPALVRALAARIGDKRLGLWFGPKTSIDWDGRVLTIDAPTKFHADYLRKHFTTDLERSSYEAFDKIPRLEFRVQAGRSTDTAKEASP